MASCETCSRAHCREHAPACPTCERPVCASCAARCGVCEKPYCPGHLPECPVCGTPQCDAHLSSCVFSSRLHCPRDRVECPSCHEGVFSGCRTPAGLCPGCASVRNAAPDDPFLASLPPHAELGRVRRWRFADLVTRRLYIGDRALVRYKLVVDPTNRQILRAWRGRPFLGFDEPFDLAVPKNGE